MTMTDEEEIFFAENEIIVSKTDLKGRITYANHVFCRVAEMSTTEVIGAPHSLIRHKDMPRAVFKLLWSHMKKGEEIFAYVKNRSKTGKYYWVIAHITPSRDKKGNIVGYHSNRRKPTPAAIVEISSIYKDLRAIEDGESNGKLGLEKSIAHMDALLADRSQDYSQFVWSVGR